MLPPFDTLKNIVNLNIVHCLSPYSGTEYFMGWDEIDYLVLFCPTPPNDMSSQSGRIAPQHCRKQKSGVMGKTKG